MARPFPIFLVLEGRKCLVLGLGREAEEKARALEESGAVVERRAAYAAGCAAGFEVVVAAGEDRSRNAEIAREARQFGALVNCLDDPAHCDFLFPSVVKQGDLQVAISTNGACPALAVRLKERLAGELGVEYAQLLELTRGARSELAERVKSFDERRRRWYELLGSPVLELLKAGRRAEAERVLRKTLFGEELL